MKPEIKEIPRLRKMLPAGWVQKSSVHFALLKIRVNKKRILHL